MASALIHLAVAKKVLEHFDVKDEKHYYLGSIAPDIAKMVGLTRKRGHFIEEGIKSDTPTSGYAPPVHHGPGGTAALL